MMFGEPITVITKVLACLGQFHGFQKSFFWTAAAADRRLIEDGEFDFRATVHGGQNRKENWAKLFLILGPTTLF